MKAAHQLRAFDQIRNAYDGSMPLHRFLPIYYRKNKQMGSTDRRWATRHIYSFFRLGDALSNLTAHHRLAISDFLCHDNLSLISAEIFPQFIEMEGLALDQKLDLISTICPTFSLTRLFPIEGKLSESIDSSSFYRSFLLQPKLFIRVKEQEIDNISQILKEKAISFEVVSNTAISFTNGTKLDGVLTPGTYQVQDFSSQKTGGYFKPEQSDKWWDCCAASGGKSLLLHSLEPKIDLLVSDLRMQILENLKERFQLAGLKNYQSKELDLLQNNEPILHHYKFDGIIVDAPCTGSGTWGRTPEMLHFFDQTKVEFFSDLQKKIVTNVAKYIKQGKPLIYITCSAFAKENEEVVNYCLRTLPLKLESMELIKGYDTQADTMFVARMMAT